MNSPVVAVFIKGLGIGGAEKLISEGAHYWDRSAFDYRVAYILPWKDQLVADLQSLEVPVECLGGPGGLSPATPFKLRRLLDQWNARLVHAHLPTAGIVARLASGRPVVYTEHNLVSSYRVMTRFVNRVTYGLNRAVTAVSPAVAEEIKGYPGPRPDVIANGVEAQVSSESVAEARNELGLGPEQPLVVHVGNVRPGKGHDVLIAATRILVRQLPEVTVVSVGGEKRNGDLARLQARAAREGVQDTIRFLGRRRDARSFIAAADVYVNPSEVEGLPVTLLEAMALGRPVVATAVGGVTTLIEDGVTGVLVPSRSPEALADAIARVLEDSVTRRRIAQAGREVVRAGYSLEKMVKSVEDIYRRVLR